MYMISSVNRKPVVVLEIGTSPISAMVLVFEYSDPLA